MPLSMPSDRPKSSALTIRRRANGPRSRRARAIPTSRAGAWLPRWGRVPPVPRAGSRAGAASRSWGADRHPERVVPARDDPGDELRFNAERRRHLARVEDAEPAARPSANVEQAMSARERRDNEIDGALDLRDSGADHRRDGRVLVVDELEYLPRRHLAQASRAGVARLGLPFHHAP